MYAFEQPCAPCYVKVSVPIVRLSLPSTGRVTHVELQNMPLGLSGIGVQLLYYERDLLKIDSEAL